ncbi:very-long-chain (3R)-3-hydroxyacyl-CoA dehydratase isoform X2 [Xenopus laevis]|uniref:Very-long-chain (3R)-3-hydroxyacyl-CoA dehydratase n=4 Tax=Xenopus laevis TaxID=8355 RepID=HACD4_XENLA|nr:very-long-chain (3R)-3-hydroxyacyl-CoA dehydratase isoform X2 [Xenopus laevis]Q6GNB5.1 RecName: Full=Very-long-chain (3R)-3-hydroxyacyl-CoA dehydratase; AltName: Full=3-hydroxyacyl-CoA dehydratase; Short=HACD; AltName: Full=Protein-tyrosine phosphatase-like A domain-containing protein 2 [Xenopus laevis]AAH73600.1 MGC82904 protein [synthetic construct]
MKTYLSIYYLIQFCGHSWIFTNMTTRFLFFGQDAFADTFYSIGLVMQGCQLLSILELAHILLGVEQNGFLPMFLQVAERFIILFVVITSQEEVQSKYIVCALFFIWNLWDVIRYPYDMLAAVDTDYSALTWLRHTWWIVAYPLSVLAEAYTIYESLPYFESLGTYSFKMALPVSLSFHFPYILTLYLVLQPVGMLYICSCLWSERKQYFQRKLKLKKN